MFNYDQELLKEILRGWLSFFSAYLAAIVLAALASIDVSSQIGLGINDQANRMNWRRMLGMFGGPSGLDKFDESSFPLHWLNRSFSSESYLESGAVIQSLRRRGHMRICAAYRNEIY
jgi:hypothetical protein